MKANVHTLALMVLIPFLFLGFMNATVYSQPERAPVHNLNTGEDFTTIQAAIDDPDTLNSHVISVDPGTYTETVTVGKSLTIQSTSGNPADTVVHAASVGNPLFRIQADDCTITGMTLEGVANYYCVYAYVVNGLTVSNNIIQDNNVGVLARGLNSFITGNTVINSGDHGIHVHSSNNCTVSDNVVGTPGNGGNGIYIYFSDNCTVHANTSSGNVGGGIALHGSDYTLITDNTVSNNPWYGFYLSHSENSTITGNTITGSAYNFYILADAVAEFVHTADTTNTVDGKTVYYWVNQQNMQVPMDAGFVCVVNSSNILVKDLTLTKNVAAVVFAGTTSSTIENVTATDNYYGLQLFASDDNTVQNNTLTTNDMIAMYLDQSNHNDLLGNQCSNTTTKANGNGIDLDESSYNTLENNTVDSNEGNGINLYTASDHNEIRDNQVTDNDRDGIRIVTCQYNLVENNTADANGYGQISLQSNAKNNTITGNTASHAKDNYNGCGITVSYSQTNTVVKNTAHSNQLDGILLSGSDSNTVSENTIHSQVSLAGIRVSSSDNNTVSDNTLDGNRRSIDVVSASTGNTIEGNFCKDSAWDGIRLYSGVQNCTVRNNVIRDCLTRGIKVDGSSNNILYHNDVMNNAVNAYDNSTNTWDDGYPSGGNYWSDYTGSDLNNDGIGDTPYAIAGGANQDLYPLMAPVNLSLSADQDTISESTGGIVNFSLNAGLSNASRSYILLAGISGSAPGTPLPGGLVVLPLNWDIFTGFVIQNLNSVVFSNFMGVLDAQGQTAAVFNTLGPLPPGMVGITMTFAYALHGPMWDFASNAVDIAIVP